MSKFVKFPLVGHDGTGADQQSDDAYVRRDTILALISTEDGTYMETSKGMFKTTLGLEDARALLEAE